MKKWVVVLTAAVFLSACGQIHEKQSWPILNGPYLGQEPPGLEPQLFLPGLISTHYVDHCIAFLDEGRVCVFAIWERGTSYMYEKDGRWTRPQKAPWQNEQGTTDFTAGPDDRTIFFQSRRPTSKNDEKQETNIWAVEWTGQDWAEPVLLPEPANTKDYSEIYPSAAPDGTLYFFSRSRPGSRPGDMGDVFFTRFIEKRAYLEAERLEDPINSDYYEVDPCVAPDGSYLLFGSGRPGGYSQLDLYICFRRDDGTWTHPVNAGSTLNPFCIPTRMSITPDSTWVGMAMFFWPTFVDDLDRLSLSAASRFQGKMSWSTLLACFLDILSCYGRDLSPSTSRTYRALPGALPLL